MAGVKLSRRKIAAYLADELVAGRPITQQLAAYLVDSKRTREATLMVRDIEAALSDKGILLADVSTSRSLATDTQQAITERLKQQSGATKVHIRPHVDPHLLGGVRIDTPGQRLDETLRNKLNQLTASKI